MYLQSGAYCQHSVAFVQLIIHIFDNPLLYIIPEKNF